MERRQVAKSLEMSLVSSVSWVALIFHVASLPVIVPVVILSPPPSMRMGIFSVLYAAVSRIDSAGHTVGAQQALGWLRSVERFCFCQLHHGVMYAQ